MNKFKIIILLLIVSCNTNDSFLRQIAEKNKDDGIIVIFHAREDNKDFEVGVNCTNLFDHIYKKKYLNKYSNFYSFLVDLTNANLLLDKEELKGMKKYKIETTSSIFDEYRIKGIKFMIQKYFARENNKLILNDNIKWNDRGNIIKIMFDEHYLATADDISGEIWFYYFEDFK